MRKRTFLAAAALGVLSLTACTGGAPGGGGDSDPDSIRYLIGQPEDTADLDLMKADIAAFTEATGIEVELDVVPSENMRTVLQTQLRSGEGPDVFGYDTGPGFAGALEEAGLLYDLTDAYSENDWPIYDFAQERVTFGGKIVGVPNDIESVGLFYNKDMFAELGLDQPETLGDLTSASEAIRDSGVIPFAVSDKEGWQGGHLLSMVLSSEVGGDEMESLIAGDTAWDSPEVVDALDVLSSYNEDGFFTPSATAVTYDNANALFYSGQAAINPTGSWLAQDIERNVDFEVGYMPFPASSSAGIFSGGLGSGLFVSKSTTKADAAVEFINWNLTPEHGRWQVENQQSIPAFPVDTADIEATPLFTQILADAAKIADGTGDFGYNVDVLMSDTFNEAMWDGVQAILTGQKDAAEVAADLETNF